MTDRQAEEPSAFSQYLATNHAIEPDYVVRGPDGDAVGGCVAAPQNEEHAQHDENRSQERPHGQFLSCYEIAQA